MFSWSQLAKRLLLVIPLFFAFWGVFVFLILPMLPPEAVVFMFSIPFIVVLVANWIWPLPDDPQ